jgi:hypothetical protein
MAGRVVLFASAFALGLFCSPAPERAKAVQAASCVESDTSRGAGIRSFCRRAERLASLPFGMQFME